MPVFAPSTRHARLFELLRQRELSKTTVRRLKDPFRLPPPEETEENFRAVALKSLAEKKMGPRPAAPAETLRATG